MHDIIKDYYGNVLNGSDDLQTNACCTDDNLSIPIINEDAGFMSA